MEGNMVKITKILAAEFRLIALSLNIIPDKKTSTTTPVTAQTEAMTESASAQSAETEAVAAATEAEQAVAETEA